MAQKPTNEIVESPRPLAPERQESIHPGLRPSVINVPVTPGINLSTYASDSSAGGTPSYFSHDIKKLREQMAPPSSDAPAEGQSDQDVLRRFSLANASASEPEVEVDPRVANPSLSLSGSVISATFCIPHILEHRNGADWVSTIGASARAMLMRHRNSRGDVVPQLSSTLSPTSPPKRRLGTIRWWDGPVRSRRWQKSSHHRKLHLRNPHRQVEFLSTNLLLQFLSMPLHVHLHRPPVMGYG